MKKFRYKFSPLIITIMCVGIVLAIAVIVSNIIRFVNATSIDSYSVVTLICTILVAIFAIVIIVSMIFWSNFCINDKFLILRWGILSQKFEISKITKVVKMEKSNKLIIHYKSETSQDNFMNVFINPEVFDDFSNFLVSKNKEILIEFTNG